MHTLCQKKNQKYFIAVSTKTAWDIFLFLGIYCLVGYRVNFALIIQKILYLAAFFL